MPYRKPFAPQWRQFKMRISVGLFRSLPFLFAFALMPLSHAQTGLVVAGAGYSLPGSSITAAPGQVLMVSVFGVTRRIAEPIAPVPGIDGLPTDAGGISVDFVQGPLTVQLPIRRIQQSPCPASGNCSPATSIVLQIPYELNPASSADAFLRVKEAGAKVGEVIIKPVTDNIHVLNTCDELGIFLSAADGVPAGTCAPVVMHARGPLVSFNAPAIPGETLVVWAYGLGALERPMPEPCCATPEQLPLAVQPFTASFSYFDSGRFPLRRLGTAIPGYVGMVGAGLYQFHFVVPPAPAGLAPCTPRLGNLQVLLTGPSSSDTAPICLQP
jgi:uncharacterized protein (TIGR03437 family)